MSSDFRRHSVLVLMIAGLATGASAQVRQGVCPLSMADARALLQRQGQIAANAVQVSHRTNGLMVLGVVPDRLTAQVRPTVLWNLGYGLESRIGANHGTAFATMSAPRGFTYECVTASGSQCRWQAPGFGNSGPQPQHRVGQLLQIQLTRNLGGGYTLACTYYARPRT